MEAPSLIESSRLVVRPAVPADAEAAFAYASDPEVTTYLTITPRETVEQVEEYLIWGEGALHRWQVHPNLSPEPADMFTYAAWR